MTASTLSLISRIAPFESRPRRAGLSIDEGARSPGRDLGALSEPVTDELTRAFARSYLRTWPISLMLALAFFAAATLWVSMDALVPGLVLITGTALVTSVACRHFLETPRPTLSIRTWRRGFVIGEAVQGSGWVLFAVSFFMDEPASHDLRVQGFVLVAMLVAMVATAVLRARIFAAVIAGLLPFGFAISVAATRTSDTEISLLALLTLGAQLLLIYFTWRLNRANAAIVRSRAEMRATVAELARAKATSSAAERRAESADRAKQLFLATMSHELRTPLNAILGFSEVMKNEVLGSHSTPSYREYSSDIHGSGQHLLALINEILDLTRIHAGHYELHEETLRLDRVLGDSLSAVAATIEAKRLRVETALDETLSPIRGDGRALSQIVGNLVSNAVKFTPRGGHIAIKAGWTSLGGQYVTVTDNGPGIPPDEIPLVMSSFGRGSLAVSTAAQGVGLGLPIVKGLAELHGGRFVLTSRVGEGTEATVIIPASRIVPEQDAVPSTEPIGSQAA